MKMIISIECECGLKASFPLKRTTNSLVDSGKVYEDYSSITDGVYENEMFSAKETPNEVTFTCKNCGTSHDLTT